jgi:hypothetical protein
MWFLHVSSAREIIKSQVSWLVPNLHKHAMEIIVWLKKVSVLLAHGNLQKSEL